MKILKLDQFLALPAGTVFCKYKPSYFEELRIKGNSLLETKDFFYCNLWDIWTRTGAEFAERCDAAESGERVELEFDVSMRDGCFDEDQMFAVFDEAELHSMASRLIAPKAAAL